MPYHLVPSGKTGVEAFAVTRAAMKKKGMVALGRLVMSTRERICAIEIEENGMLMTTLRTAEEVRDVAQMPDVPLPKPDPQMLAIAEKIVDQQAGEFDPSEFVDRYEGALRELIEEKKKGHVPRARPAANNDANVVDLMAALRNSLKVSGKERPAAPAERRRPAASRRGASTEKRRRSRGGSAA
jgi:DNA end-binding protein Ku